MVKEILNRNIHTHPQKKRKKKKKRKRAIKAINKSTNDNKH